MVSVLLLCVCARERETSFPGFHIHPGEAAHLLGVRRRTRVGLILNSSCSGTRASTVAPGDTTLLEFITTSALVHSSIWMEMRHRPRGRKSLLWCRGRRGGLRAQVKVKVESHWDSVPRENAEVITREIPHGEMTFFGSKGLMWTCFFSCP